MSFFNDFFNDFFLAGLTIIVVRVVTLVAVVAVVSVVSVPIFTTRNGRPPPGAAICD